MNRETQLVFSAFLIAPLCYILISDYKDAAITGIGVLLAFLLWKNKKRIRGNFDLMQLLRRIF